MKGEDLKVISKDMERKDNEDGLMGSRVAGECVRENHGDWEIVKVRQSDVYKSQERKGRS